MWKKWMLVAKDGRMDDELRRALIFYLNDWSNIKLPLDYQTRIAIILNTYDLGMTEMIMLLITYPITDIISELIQMEEIDHV